MKPWGRTCSKNRSDEMKASQRKDGSVMPKQTVLLVHGLSIGNSPRVRNSAAHFARRGMRVIIVRYNNKNCDKPRFERLGRGQWILRPDFRARRIPGKTLGGICAFFGFLVTVRAIVKRTSPRVLVAFGGIECLCLSFASPRSTTRVAWLLEFYHDSTKGLLRKLSVALGSRFWRLADAIVAPTRERLALHLCLRPECLTRKHFVIHNAPNLDEGSRSESGDPADTVCLAPADSSRLRIVYSGAIGRGFVLENLIKAVRSMPQDVELIMIGKRLKTGEAKSNLLKVQEAISKCINESNGGRNITWLDEIPYSELQGVLQGMDIGFVTYEPRSLNTYFSSPGKLYEYLKAGLVVLTDHGNCLSSELKAAGCAEFFSNSPSEAEIQVALSRLVSRRSDIAKMKKKARELFERKFNFDKQMEPFLAWLDEKAHGLK